MKEKFGLIYKELKNFLPKKFSLSSKNRFGIPDPKKSIPDSGSGVKYGTGSRIRISNTGFKVFITNWLDFCAVRYYSPIYSKCGTVLLRYLFLSRYSNDLELETGSDKVGK
jgi:hypothetical protein